MRRPPIPPRSIRVPDKLWAQALEATERNGETVSDVVRRALALYVRRKRVTDHDRP